MEGGSTGPSQGWQAGRRPLTFVTVRYSRELEHNLARSACVLDPINELVVIDNSGNLAYGTLSEALLAGVERARHDLVVLVHEDVLLPGGWQEAFDRSVSTLEQQDPEWWLVGAFGWTETGEPCGDCRDPRGHHAELGGVTFAEVARLDEHLLVLRRDDARNLDPALPSIHNIGLDLASTGRRRGRQTYAVNAPTVHKYADDEGRLIESAEDSPKIQARGTFAYRADRSLSDGYLAAKWSPSADPAVAGGPAPGRAEVQPDPPLVLLARGGGGSRLLSLLARDLGVFLGSEVSPAGDSLEMVHAVYRGVLGKLRYRWALSQSETVAEFREAASSMLEGRTPADRLRRWGFKVPESLLVLDEINLAFPESTFVHLVRDPLDTCLRRSHMTARFDSPIGQAALLAAYSYHGTEPTQILTDAEAVRMAITTRHQLELCLDMAEALPPSRLLTLRFEDLVADADAAHQQMGRWLDASAPASMRSADHAPPSNPERPLAETVDPERAMRPSKTFSEETIATVQELLAPLRRRLGYERPGAVAAADGGLDAAG